MTDKNAKKVDFTRIFPREDICKTGKIVKNACFTRIFHFEGAKTTD